MSLSAEQLQLFSRLAGQKGLARAEHRTSRQQSPCPVQEGEPLLTLHTDTPERFERALAALADAVTIDGEERPAGDIVLERIATD